MIGFLRVVTDYAVNAYIDDVFVLPDHRGRGVAQAMLRLALNHPTLASVSNWSLRTRDMNPLYAQFGFRVDPKPQNAMRYTPQLGDFAGTQVDAPDPSA